MTGITNILTIIIAISITINIMMTTTGEKASCASCLIKNDIINRILE